MIDFCDCLLRLKTELLGMQTKDKCLLSFLIDILGSGECGYAGRTKSWLTISSSSQQSGNNRGVWCSLERK